MPKPFELRFSAGEITRWAGEYDYRDDSRVETVIAPRTRGNGYMTREDFMELCRWKSPRPTKHCELNSEKDIRAVTAIAFATADEKLRIAILTALRGVEMRTASAILHFAGRDRYPILDVRALWSLGIDKPPKWYGFNLWWSYTTYCRELADREKVSMRVLDRSLWAYSERNQR
jgi:thermostable 8-oxoguanine DNA glycosylase